MCRNKKIVSDIVIGAPNCETLTDARADSSSNAALSTAPQGIRSNFWLAIDNFSRIAQDLD